MTEIKIKRLSIENFKSHTNLTLNFDGGNVSIYGDNATGKTSVYDALTWLLFAKDSAGNGEKNIEVKPLDANGDVKDHDALTMVEAVLLVNEMEKTLRRTYREKWETKRGSSEAIYTGNTSEYYVDGVPVKRNAFQDEVNEMVDEDTFRMLTSVSHFASGISWQDRRAVLFKVAGVMNDAQIMQSSSTFAPLLESMGRLSLEDYKKKLLSEKKKYVGAKTEIPARISECQKTIEDIQVIDFMKSKKELESLNSQKDELSEQMLQLDHNSTISSKRLEVREAQLELYKLDAENNSFREKQIAGSVNVVDLHGRLSRMNMQMFSNQKSITNESTYISQLDKQIADSRNEWISVNGESFAGANCPTCGQTLPEEQLNAAKDKFEANKKKRLNDILEVANHYKESKAQAEDRFARMQEDVMNIEAEMAAIRDQIATAESTKVEIVDMEGYGERKGAIVERINTLNGDIAKLENDTASVKHELYLKITQIKQDISNNMDIISKESLLTYSMERVEELREEAQRAANNLERIEQMLYLIDEYSRYKTRYVEESINGLFRIARFRLFREQANGGIEDRCDVVYEGVPYISVNNGMKINLGIDIINTLSVAYGVKVPLFVDNAESVTKLEQCGSQIIRLVVSEKDKELRVSYED